MTSNFQNPYAMLQMRISYFTFIYPRLRQKNLKKKREEVKKKQLAVPQSLIIVLWMIKNLSLVM